MPDWNTSESGLLVPQPIIHAAQQAVEARENLRKARAAGTAAFSTAEAMARGRFFSNLASRPWGPGGAMEKPMDTPGFGFLREMAKRSVLDRLIIDTRMDQVRNISRRVIVPRSQIGWRIVHERYQDPDFEMTDDIRERCLDMEHIIENPWKKIHSNLTHFMAQCVEEEYVIDRKAAIIMRDRNGLPRSFYLIPGDTIKTRIQVLLSFMAQQGITDMLTATEILSDKLQLDMSKTAYVQEVEGQIVAGWEEHEISVCIMDEPVQIDRKFYGRSKLEKSLIISLACMSAWNYNQQLFDINTPEGALVLLGDYDDAGLIEFERQLIGEQGPGGPHRLPVIPGDKDFDAKYLPFHESPKEMAFPEWLSKIVRLKCAAYRMHPSSINWEETGTGIQIGADETEAEVQEAKEDGLYGFCVGLAAWIKDFLIQPRYPDLIMVWEGMDRQAEDARVKNLEIRSGGAWASIDDVRSQDNMPPAKTEWKVPGDVIPNSGVIQWVMGQQQLELQKQQMAQQQDMQQQQMDMQKQQMAQQGMEEDQGDFGGDGSAATAGDPMAGPPVASGAKPAMGMKPPNLGKSMARRRRTQRYLSIRLAGDD